MLMAGGQKIRSSSIFELLKAEKEIRQVRTMILRVKGDRLLLNIGIFFKDSALSSFDYEAANFRFRRLHMMIFFIAKNGAGPVDLFRQQQPHQLMGEGQLRQRPLVIRPLKDRLVQPICPANEENK